jgi:hypothetical protein
MGMIRDWAADNWELIVHTDKEQRDLKYKGNICFDIILSEASVVVKVRPSVWSNETYFRWFTR